MDWWSDYWWETHLCNWCMIKRIVLSSSTLLTLILIFSFVGKMGVYASFEILNFNVYADNCCPVKNCTFSGPGSCNYSCGADCKYWCSASCNSGWTENTCPSGNCECQTVSCDPCGNHISCCKDKQQRCYRTKCTVRSCTSG